MHFKAILELEEYKKGKRLLDSKQKELLESKEGLSGSPSKLINEVKSRQAVGCASGCNTF